jgi:hypothetical protein
MTSHLTEDQMVALLQGTLAADARDKAKRHLGACVPCADALTREATLDALLWEARHAVVAPAPTVAHRDRRGGAAASRPPPRGRARSWAGAAIAVAAATAIGYASSAGVTSASGRSPMGNLLAWQNVIFYIPLAVGLLLILGSAFGVHDHDADHDAGHVGDHDHDVGHHDGQSSLFERAFALLGVGRVPLTLVLMITSLYFGGLGLILNTLLSSAGLAPSLYGPISVAGAFAGMVVLSGATARLIHRHLPMSESYSISRHDFAGCTGTLLLPADSSSGYAQVKDREGNVHNIRCRTMTGALPKGTAILVVEYDEDSKIFIIDANPEPPVT